MTLAWLRTLTGTMTALFRPCSRPMPSSKASQPEVDLQLEGRHLTRQERLHLFQPAWLIRRLVQDPAARLTMPRVMKHSWVTRGAQWPLRTVREMIRAGDTLGDDEAPEMPDFMSTLNVLDIPRQVRLAGATFISTAVKRVHDMAWPGALGTPHQPGWLELVLFLSCLDGVLTGRGFRVYCCPALLLPTGTLPGAAWRPAGTVRDGASTPKLHCSSSL